MKKLVLLILIMIMNTSAAYSYTGLIIDATSSDSPVKIGFNGIVNNTDIQLNKKIGNSVNDVIERGIICYTTSVDKAKISGFVGENPLIVRASSRFDGLELTNIVIPAEDAEKIIRTSEKPNYLGNLKIAFVL